MRIIRLFILGVLLTMMASAGLNCYAHEQREQQQAAQVWIQHREELARDQSRAPDNRTLNSPPPADTYAPGNTDTNADQQFDVHYDWQSQRRDRTFDWPHFALAVLLLTGGIMVCRRIFRGAAAPRRMQYRYEFPKTSPPPPVVPTATHSLGKMCPRADCNSTNPPMAKFCRRCGAALKET